MSVVANLGFKLLIFGMLVMMPHLMDNEIPMLFTLLWIAVFGFVNFVTGYMTGYDSVLNEKKEID